MEKFYPSSRSNGGYVHTYKQRGGGGIPLRSPFDGHVYFSRFLRRFQIKTRPSIVGAQIIDDKHASPARCGEGARSSNSSDDDDAAGLVLFYKQLSSESRYCINLRFPVRGIAREYDVFAREACKLSAAPQGNRFRSEKFHVNGKNNGSRGHNYGVRVCSHGKIIYRGREGKTIRAKITRRLLPEMSRSSLSRNLLWFFPRHGFTRNWLLT